MLFVSISHWSCKILRVLAQYGLLAYRRLGSNPISIANNVLYLIITWNMGDIESIKKDYSLKEKLINDNYELEKDKKILTEQIKFLQENNEKLKKENEELVENLNSAVSWYWTL